MQLKIRNNISYLVIDNVYRKGYHYYGTWIGGWENVGRYKF
jgi:hypothetical protein